MIEIAASLLAADRLRLYEEADRMLKAGASRLHIDVMDGRFVPNLSFGPALVRALRNAFPDANLDVHLMTEEPLRFMKWYADAGATCLTVHLEAALDLEALIVTAGKIGVRFGISIKPQTRAEALLPYLKKISQVLVMTVEPGAGGQPFMPEMAEKIGTLRKLGFTGDIAVDGGINEETAKVVIASGGNVLVMGTALFKNPDPAALIQRCVGEGAR